MTTSQISRSRKGFTLMELLAVMVIASILAVIALQGLKVVGSTALQTGARQFANDLQLARQYAITKRTRVRVLLAVDPTTNLSAGLATDSVYRAYCVYALSNTNNTLGTRLTDWRVLPTGVLFSDHNCTTYVPLNLVSAGTPPSTTRSLNTSSPSGSAYFNGQTNVLDAITYTNYLGSGIDFIPTGQVQDYYHAGGANAGGVRLAQGAVDPSTWKFIIQNSNNWVYVEYDYMSGRIRTRWSDSYK